MRAGLPTRALVVLTLVVGVVVVACTTSTENAPAAGSSGSGVSSLAMPLPSFDPEAFRAAEASLRKDGRDKAGLAKLGPGALELATLMDRTASFLLVQSQAKMTALAPSGTSLMFARSIGSGSAGRLAAPLRDLPPPGAPIVGAYLMTTLTFNMLISKLIEESGRPPSSITGDNDPRYPQTDTVTVAGNKGTITTTFTGSAGLSGSRLSLLIQIKVSGEVRDAATGAILYKIANEATGNASGDVCPDTSGVARAQLTFRGREDYFDASGAKTGTGVDEGFGGELRIKADDNAKLAGVDITTTGGVAAAGSLAKELGSHLIELAAKSAAPEFEKAWRSGLCIAVLVDPEGGDVDKDSVTTVTVKVKHKSDGNELDKPVEATLYSGVKSIDPTGKKQKAPATFKYTAGSEDADPGYLTFESVSNRGIGKENVTFTVAGGSWTISATGSSSERYRGVIKTTLRVTITDLKITSDKAHDLSGEGTMSLTGPVSADIANYMSCSGQVDYKVRFTAEGELVGSGAQAVLRLTLTGTDGDDGTLVMDCVAGPYKLPQSSQPAPYSPNYAFALGQLDLPVGGGTRTITRSTTLPGDLMVDATGTFTVTRGKP